MKSFSFSLGVLVVLGMAPASFADITDFLLNIGGTAYCANYGATGCSNAVGSLSGAAGTVSTVDESYGGTGLGTVTVTFDPGVAGTYDIGLWAFEQLSGSAGGAGFNEYGQVNGSTGSGQSWQIDAPDYLAAGDPNTSATGTIIANTSADTLSNSNDVPGGSGTCPGPNCNDFTSMAMNFDFTLTASEEEVVTFNLTNTNPGGFSLQQIHPANDPNDGGNNPELDLFLSGSAITQSSSGPPPPSVPEPGSLVLLATVAGGLIWRFRSRFAAVNGK